MSGLLSLRGLRVAFAGEGGAAMAVRGVDLELEGGEGLALVGESGSGKSATAKAILGLHDMSSTAVTGSVRFEGRELLELGEAELRSFRGRGASMVFQDPGTSFNPLLRMGEQVAEAFRSVAGLDRKAAREAALGLFSRLGIRDPVTRYAQYPHEFSGGMLQRMMILLALAGRPRLLVADEPTTALDVTVQAQVLLFLEELKEELGMAVLLVTHDMGIVAETSTRIAVMYAGRIVETGGTAEVLGSPAHPYTEALLEAMPRPGSRGTRLATILGLPPGVYEADSGCPFFPRCRHALASCMDGLPPSVEAGPGRKSACFRTHSLSLRGIA